MNQKQRQRLGSAIGSAILSCAALSLTTIDTAQAAVLTYNFGVGGGPSGFLSLTTPRLEESEMKKLQFPRENSMVSHLPLAAKNTTI